MFKFLPFLLLASAVTFSVNSLAKPANTKVDIKWYGDTSIAKCEAVFTFTPAASTALPAAVKFNSSKSHGGTTTDNIAERLWSWGDGSSLADNQVDPTHSFTQPGNYTVCLVITTAQKCISKSCITISINKPEPPFAF